MTTFTSWLQAREPIAEGTMAFHLEKPPGFAFKPGQAIDLVLSGSSPEDCAFLAELQQLESLNPRFHLIATMTQMERSSQSWTQRTGPIDAELVKQATCHLPAPIFYIAGPPGLVEAMQLTLAAAGVDDDDVRNEAFYGY